MVQEDKIPSMILYGPPGTGKTTLAKMIAGMTKSDFSRLNAVSAGISDVRKIIEKLMKIEDIIVNVQLYF